MKNHFIFGYTGNKRNEVEIINKYIEKKINLENIKIIIEPFAGTSAMSYYISTLYPKKYKYVINDNDENLINLYRLMKDEDEFKLFLEKINNLLFNENNEFIKKDKYNELVKNNNLESYFIKNKFYNLRPGLYPSSRKVTKLNILDVSKMPICQFLRDEEVELYSKEAVEIVNQYNNKDNLILLDPPYILTDNTKYKQPSDNIYEYLVNNKNTLNNTFIILEFTWIIKLLFRDIEKFIYEKKYFGNKKKTVEHAIGFYNI